MSDINLQPILYGTVQTVWGELFNENFNKIAVHNHSTGKGAEVSLTDINIKSDIRADSILARQVQVVSIQDLKNCIGTIDGDLYIYSEVGSSIRITNGKYLNLTSDTVGGFTGDYVTAGAECIYTDSTNTYAFTNDGTTLSGIVCQEIVNQNLADVTQAYIINTPTIIINLAPDVGTTYYTATISTPPVVEKDGIVFNGTSSYQIYDAEIFTVGQPLESLHYIAHVFSANSTDAYPVNTLPPVVNRLLTSTVTGTGARTTITRPWYNYMASNRQQGEYAIGEGGDMFSGGFMNNYINYSIGYPGSRSNYIFIQDPFDITVYPNSYFSSLHVFSQHSLGA